jgi:GNAT superfamily N-acetyltransferase
MITYRRATLSDLPVIKELTDKMLAPTCLGLATSAKIINLLTNSAVNFELVFDDEQCVGYMAGVIHETLFNDIVRASDIGMYIIPGYRGGKLIDELLDRFEAWARSRGASQLWLGQTTGNKIDLTKRFYERKGYTVVGVNCVKEI